MLSLGRQARRGSAALPIDDDEKDKIFEKFVSGKAPMQQKIAGSGIGLWLAVEIMSLNDGAIKLDQRLNPTLFRLTFRRASEYTRENSDD